MNTKDEAEDLYIQGTRDSSTYELDTSIFIIQVFRCQNGNGIECASNEEASQWLADKNLVPAYFNPYSDFTSNSYDAEGKSALLETYKWFPSIPLRGDSMSDSGYRFRYNEYSRSDQWLPF